MLLQKVKQQRSVAGISSKMLEMYVLVFVFRLSSTLIKQGYLPIDRSGDWVYQSADIASLMLVFQLLWKVHKVYNITYQRSHDTLEIWRAVPAAIAMGIHSVRILDPTTSMAVWEKIEREIDLGMAQLSDATTISYAYPSAAK